MGAVSQRTAKPDGGDSTTELEARLAAAERMITLLMRVASRAAVRYSRGATSATFRRIITSEMTLATGEEAAEIEAWLTDHQGG